MNEAALYGRQLVERFAAEAKILPGRKYDKIYREEDSGDPELSVRRYVLAFRERETGIYFHARSWNQRGHMMTRDESEPFRRRFDSVDFYELGRQAYANGESSAPTLNAQVRQAIADLSTGSVAAEIMKAFAKGWHDANLDDEKGQER